MEYLGTDKPVNKIMPLVSVCMTTYNHKDFVAECLDSVLMLETDFPFEIIVGEDESTDGTREICKQYAEKHPDKIRFFLRSEKDKIYINGSKTGRFNFIKNLKAARGEFIALCDGDDYWTNSLKLQRQVNFLKSQKQTALVHHHFSKLYPDGNLKPTSIKPLEKSTTVEIIKNFNVRTSTMLFRNYFSTVPLPDWVCSSYVGDNPLTVFLSLYGDIRYMNDNMAIYRVDVPNGMLAKTKAKRHIGGINMYKEMIADERLKSFENELKSKIASLYRREMLSLIQAKEKTELLNYTKNQYISVYRSISAKSFKEVKLHVRFVAKTLIAQLFFR